MALRDRLIDDIRPLGSRPTCAAATMDILDRLEIQGIQGDFVECGVWRGAQPILARSYIEASGYRPRKYWLFDTFSGMPQPGQHDVTIEGHTATHKPKDWLAVPRAQVEHNFAIRGLLDDEQIVFVEGRVEQTLLEPQNLPERICYLRLDTDFYTSTEMALKVLYPRLESGGALVIDDYGWWRGAQKATDEYFGGEPVMEQIDRSARLLWKPHG